MMKSLKSSFGAMTSLFLMSSVLVFPTQNVSALPELPPAEIPTEPQTEAQTTEALNALGRDLDQIAQGDFNPSRVQITNLSQRTVNLILSNQGLQVQEFLSTLIQNLHIAGDAINTHIRIIPDSRVVVEGSRVRDLFTLDISLGTLARLHSVDEVAFLIAQQMAHQNQRGRPPGFSEGILSTLVGRNGVSNSVTVGEPRATVLEDIQAFYRLIKGGYHPLGGVRLLRKAQEERQDFELSRSVLPSIRATVQMALFNHESSRRDLSGLLTQETPYLPGLQQLRVKLAAWMTLTELSRDAVDRGQVALQTGRRIGTRALDFSKGVLAFGAGLAAVVTIGGAVVFGGSYALNTVINVAQQGGADPFLDAVKQFASEFVANKWGAATLALLGSHLVDRFGAVLTDQDREREGYQELLSKLIKEIREARAIPASDPPARLRHLSERVFNYRESQFLSEFKEMNQFGLAGATSLFGAATSLTRVDNLILWFKTKMALRGLNEILTSEIPRGSDADLEKLFERLNSNRITFSWSDRTLHMGQIVRVLESRGSLAEPKLSQFKNKVNALSELLDSIEGTPQERVRAYVRTAPFFNEFPPELFLKLVGNEPFEFAQLLSRNHADSNGLRIFLSTLSESRFGTKFQGFISTLRELTRLGRSPTPMERLRFWYILRGMHPARSLGDTSIAMGNDNAGSSLSALASALLTRFNRRLPTPQRVQDLIVNGFSNLEEFMDALQSLRRDGYFDHFSSTGFSEFAYLVLFEHPEWIQTRAQIETIINEHNFWPGSYAVHREDGTPTLGADIARNWLRLRSEKQNSDVVVIEAWHHLFMQRLEASQQVPLDFEGRFELWNLLVKHQRTSSTSDNLFLSLWEIATPTQKRNLAIAAQTQVGTSLVWDPTVRQELASHMIRNSPEFEAFVASQNQTNQTSRNIRKDNLTQMLRIALRYLDAGESAVTQLFRELAREWMVRPEEARYIERILSLENQYALIYSSTRYERVYGRGRAGDYSRVVGDGMQLLQGVFTDAQNLNPRQQWDLLQYLRGDIAVTPELRSILSAIGAERTQQMFLRQTQTIRSQQIMALLIGQGGLLHGSNYDANYRRIVHHLLSKLEPQGQEVALEILNALLDGMAETNLREVKDFTLAYLLSEPIGDGSAGDVLRRFLERFDTLGIKLGQFLPVAADLPADVVDALSRLENHAAMPHLYEIYEELAEALGLPRESTELPYEVLEILGSASVKITVRAREKSTGREVVLKIFRTSARATTPLYFRVLSAGIQKLVRTNPRRYGSLRAVARAVKEAIDREMVFADEVRRSDVMREQMYGTREGFFAPRERLITDRLIESEMVTGASIRSLTEVQQADAARRVLAVEGELYFPEGREMPTDSSPRSQFEPDRHPGNTLIETRNLNQGLITRVGVIDPGQLQTEVTGAHRRRVIDLYAHAMILGRAGATDWSAHELCTLLGIPLQKRAVLRRALAQFFPNSSNHTPSHYFNVLGALEAIGEPQPTVFFDFLRGIAQTTRYEPYLTDQDAALAQAPTRILETLVTQRIAELNPSLHFRGLDLIRFGINNPGEACSRLMTRIQLRWTQ